MSGLIPKFETLRRECQARLPEGVFDYIDGGADDEHTLRHNRTAWASVKLVPRVMREISRVDTSCTLFGEKLAAPLLVSPMAAHGWAHEEAEIATARAAEKCGIPLCVSMFSTRDIEDIRNAGIKAKLYQQVYILKNRQLMTSFFKEVYNHGCGCIVLTVDAPTSGNREKIEGNKFAFDGESLSLYKKTEWKEHKEASTDLATVFVSGLAVIDWSVIRWIKETADFTVLVKGILSPADAALAVEHGADGIIVSNHGGRQLDTAVTAVDVLPSIAAVVNKRVPILADGGIQRGTDILKALAMGASAVLIGRPILYALASKGSQGVEEVLEDLTKEFSKSLHLCGFASVDEITSDVLYRTGRTDV